MRSYKVGLSRIIAAALTTTALLIVTACDINPRFPNLNVNVRNWYSSQKILIPYSLFDSDTGYAEYRYEHNSGTGWVVDVERTVQIPESERGLIELFVRTRQATIG